MSKAHLCLVEDSKDEEEEEDDLEEVRNRLVSKTVENQDALHVTVKF